MGVAVDLLVVRQVAEEVLLLKCRVGNEVLDRGSKDQGLGLLTDLQRDLWCKERPAKTMVRLSQQLLVGMNPQYLRRIASGNPWQVRLEEIPRLFLQPGMILE